MSEKNTGSDQPEELSNNPFDSGGKERLFGFRKQGLIKFFFGKNAAFSVIILFAICAFLVIEAFRFFPDYQRSLSSYRKSGQEYVTYLEEQYKAQKAAVSLVDKAYNVERTVAGEQEFAEMAAFSFLRGEVENAAEEQYEAWEEVFEEWEELQEEWEDEKDDLSAEEQAEAKLAVATAKEAEVEAREAWKVKVKEVLNEGFDQPESVDSATWTEIKKAVTVLEPDTALPDFLKVRNERVDAKVDVLAKVTRAMKDSVLPLETLWFELRDDVATPNRQLAINFKDAPERKAALEAGAAKVKTEKEREEMLKEAAAIVIVEPDFDELTKPMYASQARAAEISKNLLVALELAKTSLPQPSSMKAPEARESLEQAGKMIDENVVLIEASAKNLQEWRHDKPYSMTKTVFGFFFGTKWVTNSDWQDFYGLLPLLSGSLMISVIALLFAVPLSIAAAIYTNQLAHRHEAKFVKPVIEFIQAIPSVVLGIFGILVLGEALQELSQKEWLSWVPGFPMQERLNMLNAGLLLAFMAVPTIYTLAEDAINNVPNAYRDASYALGASKLQTVMKVIVPTAISGILAAVLLGFGRVIGETMVVLLVAGNKISLPDFSAGVGVVTQSAHTMTGLIAQETGEVSPDSLHWRALFMLALILFSISLTINWIAQRLIRRFQKHG